MEYFEKKQLTKCFRQSCTIWRGTYKDNN